AGKSPAVASSLVIVWSKLSCSSLSLRLCSALSASLRSLLICSGEANPVIRDSMIPLDQSPIREVRTAPAESQPMQNSCGPMEEKTENLVQSPPGNNELYFVPTSEADFTQRKPR